MSYSKLLQKSRVMRNSFMLYKSDFIILDPDYDDSFADKWLSAIDIAAACNIDESVRSEQTGKTVNVENVMEKCREKFAETIRFVKKAFPGNTPVINEFGDNVYRKIKNNQVEMGRFMQNLY
ncbi:MAG: hypothetical protein M1480_12275, partial [Bacteroidetes bacterium]|nr:hypothetical protein [Bacteroidota bacterium]